MFHIAVLIPVFLAAIVAIGEPTPVAAPDSFSIAPDGNFVINGHARYLLGTIIYHQPAESDFRHTDGYSDEDAWIYETKPNRAYLQRLGFDTVGGEVSLTWMQKFRPEPQFWQAHCALDWGIATNWWLSGLPTIVDFTCARWSHGALQPIEGRAPSAAAIPPGGAGHFMPYSLITTEGRALYAEMWRSGAEELKAHGATPYAYELFNEPTWDERTHEARNAFARDLETLFDGDSAAMDSAWGSRYGSFKAAAAFKQPFECAGLGVEWLKFRERTFASGIRLGAETIRKVVPDARVCFQPLGISFGYVNVLEANRDCGVVMSPTGGGSSFDALLLLAVADGKPIIDGETYLGHTRASHRAKILTQYARGFNASYYFKWDRRLNDKKFHGPDGPQRMAETFPYMALNPAATPPEAFKGLLDAKREIAAVEDLFNPRSRGIPHAARAAILFSFPTERLGVAAGHVCHNFVKASADALISAHLPLAAFFEEQLPEGRLDRYRFLVASGIDATYPDTVATIRDWVSRGGTLVLLQEAMQFDEWARPKDNAASFGLALGERLKGESRRFDFGDASFEGAPFTEVSATNGWETVSQLPDGKPAILSRRIGEGRAYFVSVRLPKGEEARLLAAMALEADVTPTVTATDFVNGEPLQDVEVHAAKREGETGFILILRGLAPHAVRLVPGRDFPAPMLLDVSRNVVLAPDADGAFLLLLEPDVPVVLRQCKNTETSDSICGSAALAANPQMESYSNVVARLPAWLAEHAPKTVEKVFSADPSRVKFLDLRQVANRSFGDSVAGDGKGGWTDQGENCLRNVPWGVTDCNGVPFDFIRPDQNEDRACIILRSTHLPDMPDAVRGIEVNMRAEALYFLQAGGWLDRGEGEAFRYVVRYADGTAETLPMVAGRDFGDWWTRTRGKFPATARYRVGWTNSENRGFHVLRWDNPHPNRTISSIDIESANKGTIPIIAAITAELPDESPLALWRFKPHPWGGADTAIRNGGLEMTCDDATTDWAGVKFSLVESVALGDDWLNADLVFEVNGGDNALGTRDIAPPPFQVSAEGTRGILSLGRGNYVAPSVDGKAVDDNPDTWQTARIPLKSILPDGSEKLTAVFIQFRAMPSHRAGLVMRRFRVKQHDSVQR